jgi:hypothetical protein
MVFVHISLRHEFHPTANPLGVLQETVGVVASGASEMRSVVERRGVPGLMYIGSFSVDRAQRAKRPRRAHRSSISSTARFGIVPEIQAPQQT